MATISRFKDRLWSEQPRAQALLQGVLAEILDRSPSTARLAQRLLDTTAVRLRDIIDHLVIADAGVLAEARAAGWARSAAGVWTHPEGMFPALLDGSRSELWLRVESVDTAVAVLGSQSPIDGPLHGRFRRAVVQTEGGVVIGVLERCGFPGYELPGDAPATIRRARLALQSFRSRRREFDRVEQGLVATESMVDAAVADIGEHWACDLWLRAEREYWIRRCAPGRMQKERQDAAGIGFANIDHHTYDGSRRHFRHTIRILEKLGYELREMLYAGELSGWGSQVLEQPVIGSTIFADVDLAPHELTVDFAHEELPELPRHRRAGVLCELLGESILEAGLNHVACLFDQRHFREQMVARRISMMAPFTSFPYLYQELTEGDWTAVDARRVDALEAGGHISATEAERLRLDGSILSHLENIERNNGYKGFNREGIDSVLRKLDPRVLQGRSGDTGAGSLRRSGTA